MLHQTPSSPQFVSWHGSNCFSASQAGFFPVYTLGEDMALALEIQKAGWKGAYVKEYMAVGEVPETIRNAFMQVLPCLCLSTWAQGA